MITDWYDNTWINETPPLSRIRPTNKVKLYHTQQRLREKPKMNLMETALKYVKPRTMNIADLDKVCLKDMEVEVQKGVDSQQQKYAFFYFEIEDQKYRIPNSVIEGIQELLESKPKTTHITVTKKGSGKLGTRYVVTAA